MRSGRCSWEINQLQLSRCEVSGSAQLWAEGGGGSGSTGHRLTCRAVSPSADRESQLMPVIPCRMKPRQSPRSTISRYQSGSVPLFDGGGFNRPQENACVPLSFTAEGCERRRRRFFLEGPPWGLAGGTLRCPLQRRGGHGRRGDLFRLGSLKIDLIQEHRIRFEK